jgi:hypothetical protein
LATFIPASPGLVGENVDYDRESGNIDANNLQSAIDKLAEFVGYGDMTKVDVITIREEHLSNKRIVLTKPPISWEKIRVAPEGGPNQIFYKDFIIQNDSELVWANLGLDGLLEVGDVLVVEYFF